VEEVAGKNTHDDFVIMCPDGVSVLTQEKVDWSSEIPGVTCMARKISLQIQAGTEFGLNQHELTVALAKDNRHLLKVPVGWSVTPQFDVIPSEVYLSPRTDQEPSAGIQVASRDGLQFQILHVLCDLEWIDVQVADESEEAERHTVTLRSHGRTPGVHKGTIRILTSREIGQELTVPVTVLIRPSTGPP